MNRRSALAGAAALGAAFARPAGAQAPPLKIGFIYSYTGGTAWAAKSQTAAIGAWQRLHGDTVAGRKVQLITRDDTGIAPDVARRQAQELIVQERIDLLLGTNLTPNAIAVARISTEAKKPFFIINSATSNVLKDAPYAARFGFTTQQIVPPLAQYAFKNYGKTAYTIYQDYGPGIDAAKAFTRAFIEAGGSMLGEAPIPVSNLEFTPFLSRARDAKPATIFIFLNASGGGGELLKEISETGLLKTGVKVVATGDILDEFITPALSSPPLGLVTSFNYSRAHPTATNRQFVSAYHAAIGDGSGPDFATVATFDALHAIWNVTEALHGDVSDPDKVMTIVRGMKIDSPRGPLVIDASTRDAVQNVYLRRLERVNGQLENVEFATFPLVKDPTQTY